MCQIYGLNNLIILFNLVPFLTLCDINLAHDFNMLTFSITLVNGGNIVLLCGRIKKINGGEMPNDEKSNTWRDTISILSLLLLATPFQAVGVIIMWLISRWSYITKWIVTAVVIINLGIFGKYSINAYKYYGYQKAFTPLLSVQQALDIYGVVNGKYPDKVDQLKPKYILSIPEGYDIQYSQLEDGKSYSLKAKVNGKEIELRPSFTQLPEKSS